MVVSLSISLSLRNLLGLHGDGGPHLLQLSRGLGSQLQEQGVPAAGKGGHSSRVTIHLSRNVTGINRGRRSWQLLSLLFSLITFDNFCQLFILVLCQVTLLLDNEGLPVYHGQVFNRYILVST